LIFFIFIVKEIIKPQRLQRKTKTKKIKEKGRRWRKEK